MEMRAADRAARVLLRNGPRLAHGKLPRLVILAHDGVTDIRGMERERRTTGAFVHRDEHALGTTAQPCGGCSHLVPPAAATTTVAAAATAAAAVAAATTTAAAATTATAARTLLRDVDAERATLEILTVELVQSLLGTFLRRHLDEAEAARLTGHPVEHQLDLLDLTARGELLLDQIFSGVEGQVADVQTISHKLSRCVSH